MHRSLLFICFIYSIGVYMFIFSFGAQLCLTLCDSIDQGIFQARILEWVAISSSNVYVFLCYVFTWLRQILVMTCGIFDLSRGLQNVVL